MNKSIQGICLRCHGETLSFNAVKKVQPLCPHDQTTGLMKGAYSMTKRLN